MVLMTSLWVVLRHMNLQALSMVIRIDIFTYISIQKYPEMFFTKFANMLAIHFCVHKLVSRHISECNFPDYERVL